MGIFVFSVSFFLFFLFAPLALIIVIFLLFWFKMETVYCTDTRFASRWEDEGGESLSSFAFRTIDYSINSKRFVLPKMLNRISPWFWIEKFPSRRFNGDGGYIIETAIHRYISPWKSWPVFTSVNRQLISHWPLDNLAARRNVFPCKCHRLYPKNTHTHTCTHGYTRISNHRGIRGRAGLDPTSFFAYFPPRYRRECIAKRYTPTLPLATIRPVSSRICSNTLAKPAQWNVHLRDRVRATFIRICNHLRDPPPPTLMKLIPGIIGTRFTILFLSFFPSQKDIIIV